MSYAPTEDRPGTSSGSHELQPQAQQQSHEEPEQAAATDLDHDPGEKTFNKLNGKFFLYN